MSTSACPECGARLAEGSERCDLCGTPVGSAAAEPTSEIEPDDIPEPETVSDAAEADGVYCNECGWKNPVGAKFCSRCGQKLQDVASNPGGGGAKPAHRSRSAPGSEGSASDHSAKPALGPPSGTQPRETSGSAAGGDAVESEADSAVNGAASSRTSDSGQADLTRYVGVLIGLAVLVVVALYMITVVSKQQVSAQSDVVQAPADVRSAAVIDEYEAIPIAAQHAPTVDSLRQIIAGADGDEVQEARYRLVEFLMDIGRIDRAAIEQQRFAKESGRVDDWRYAGNLLFDWMESVSSERKTDVALLTIDAYERVLEEQPEDLDARADLGWAYQYDPQNPMQAIQHTNIVLQEAPDHLTANYNRGVFLLRINRVDEAIAQFEKVKDIAGEGSPYFRQADAWIESIQRRQSES